MLDLNNEKIAAKDIQIYFAEGELGKMLDLKEVHLLQKIIFQLSKMGFLLLAKSEKMSSLDLKI